jgi:hypothetical protein
MGARRWHLFSSNVLSMAGRGFSAGEHLPAGYRTLVSLRVYGEMLGCQNSQSDFLVLDFLP